MNLGRQVKANLDYGKKLVISGFEGAAQGRTAFLDGDPLSPFLTDAALRAWKQATIGACIGLLGGYFNRRHKTAGRAVAFSAIGGIIGFGAGLTWRTQRLTTSMGQGAVKNVNAVRDQHWLDRNPINYA